MWARRAASQSSLDQCQTTPDLVMDLPAGTEDPISGPDSPGAITPPTAAETFARQNQSTLKKNTKTAACLGIANNSGATACASTERMASSVELRQPAEEVTTLLVVKPAAAAKPQVKLSFLSTE